MAELAQLIRGGQQSGDRRRLWLHKGGRTRHGGDVESGHAGIPVATSLKGKGVVAEGTDLSLGCLGVTSNGMRAVISLSRQTW